jgi:hypothetical protein
VCCAINDLVVKSGIHGLGFGVKNTKIKRGFIAPSYQKMTKF